MKEGYNHSMDKLVVHISEAEAARDFASLLARVRAGAEVVIERDARPVAVVRPAEPVRRTLTECIEFLRRHSMATVDPDFARDVKAAVESHREPLDAPAWDWSSTRASSFPQSGKGRKPPSF